MEVNGLAALKLDDEFKGLSALREGKGKAANATQVAARAREDEQLAIRLMKSLGYYDATAISTLQRETAADGEAGRLKVVLTATPGRLYRLSSITVDAQPTVPTDLIRSNLPLKVGDPIEAARIEGRRPMSAWSCRNAAIPSSRWDSATSCWRIRRRAGWRLYAAGRYGAAILVRQADDGGRQGVRPRSPERLPAFRGGAAIRFAADRRSAQCAGRDRPVQRHRGRAQADRPHESRRHRADRPPGHADQGPARTLSGEAGYSTGQGVRVQGSFTNRNAFPPEGRSSPRSSPVRRNRGSAGPSAVPMPGGATGRSRSSPRPATRITMRSMRSSARSPSAGAMTRRRSGRRNSPMPLAAS